MRMLVAPAWVQVTSSFIHTTLPDGSCNSAAIYRHRMPIPLPYWLFPDLRFDADIELGRD